MEPGICGAFMQFSTPMVCGHFILRTMSREAVEKIVLNESFSTLFLRLAQGSRALLGQYLLHSFDNLGWLIQNLIQQCLKFFARGWIDIHPALFRLRE